MSWRPQSSYADLYEVVHIQLRYACAYITDIVLESALENVPSFQNTKVQNNGKFSDSESEIDVL